MATQGISFQERNSDEPIIYEGSTNEVCEGCEVHLEHAGSRITARIVQYTPGEPCVGEVTGFPGNDSDQIGELKIGSTIHFEDRHIFSCAA